MDVGEGKGLEESGEWLVASGEPKQEKEQKEKKDFTTERAENTEESGNEGSDVRGGIGNG